MKISSLNLPEDERVGLKEIRMSRLDRSVVLAGPNGAGKSRFFEKLRASFSQKLVVQNYEGQKKHLEHWRQRLNSDEQLLAPIESSTVGFEVNEAGRLRQSIATAKKEIERSLEALQKDSEIITKPDHSASYQFISFTPNSNTLLRDSHQLTKGQLLSSEEGFRQLGVQGAAQNAIPLLQLIQDRWFNATHPESSLEEDERFNIVCKYKKLVEFVGMFLGGSANLDRNVDGDATLFGLRAGAANLSEGQKLLLQFCITLFAQESDLKDLIVFMDEPEKHLHPAALIQVVDKLQSVLTDGQLWIATHSINLLSHVPPTSIWYMENGAVSYSGNKPERVIKGLVGDSCAVGRLCNFMALPEQMAANQFTFECLFPPLTVETGSEDPQTNQIIDSIRSCRDQNQTIRVVDFGAGKGRLLSTVNELDSPVVVSEWLDYIAYDLPSEDESICRSHISETYSDRAERYFSSDKILKETVEKHSVDMIVMCNVFHEIDPKDWPELFSEYGIIRYLLKKDGFLLIVEDQHLPYGEKAFANGFLVFDKIQFKELFNLGAYEDRSARSGRLKSHKIPASALSNLTSASRSSAISSLKDDARGRIKGIRGKADPTFRDGQMHSFWSQQLTNASLASEELGEG